MLVAAFITATAYLFVFPRQDAPGHADAIVVLSGATSERLDKALELMRAGVAPTLVISDGRDPAWRQAERLCHGVRFHVLCFRPDPYSTRGEAEEVARLARARRWRAIDIVTSRYHVFRARLIFRRCYRGTLRIVASRPGLLSEVVGTLYEWPKLAVAETIRRGC